jgi:hypothetical protein
MWCVKAEAHDGNVYTLGIFPSRRAAESYKIVAKRWKRFWVEPTPANNRAEGRNPAATTTEVSRP